MSEPISWTHPLAWGVYVFAVLNLFMAAGLFWVRQQIIYPQKGILLVDAAEVQAQLQEVTAQLVLVNRQADRGLDQLEQLLNLSQGLFLALIETKLVTEIITRLRKRPLVLKLVVKKSLETVFAQAEAAVRTHHIENRDEVIHE